MADHEANLPAPPQQEGGIEYRHIPGWPGYCISDAGAVFTCKKQGIDKTRSILSWTLSAEWRLMKGFVSNKGYPHVTLNHNRQKKSRAVHRLVLLAFVGPCPAGMQACHGNGNRSDNRLCNLRWDTPSSNNADKHRHGTAQTGSRGTNAKLSDAQVLEIKCLLAQGEGVKPIANRFGVRPGTIRFIRQRQTWKYVI